MAIIIGCKRTRWQRRPWIVRAALLACNREELWSYNGEPRVRFEEEGYGFVFESPKALDDTIQELEKETREIQEAIKSTANVFGFNTLQMRTLASHLRGEGLWYYVGKLLEQWQPKPYFTNFADLLEATAEYVDALPYRSRELFPETQQAA